MQRDFSQKSENWPLLKRPKMQISKKSWKSSRSMTTEFLDPLTIQKPPVPKHRGIVWLMFSLQAASIHVCGCPRFNDSSCSNVVQCTPVRLSDFWRNWANFKTGRVWQYTEKFSLQNTYTIKLNWSFDQILQILDITSNSSKNLEPYIKYMKFKVMSISCPSLVLTILSGTLLKDQNVFCQVM